MVLVTFRNAVYLKTASTAGAKTSIQPVVAVEGTWTTGSGSDGKITVSSILPQNEDNLVPVASFVLETVSPANSSAVAAVQENA